MEKNILQTSLYFVAASSFFPNKVTATRWQLRLTRRGTSGHTGCFWSRREAASPQYLSSAEKTTPKPRRRPIGELLDVQPLLLARLPGAALHLLLSFSTQRNFTVNADRPHGSESGGNEEVIRSISGEISFYNIIRKRPLILLCNHDITQTARAEIHKKWCNSTKNSLLHKDKRLTNPKFTAYTLPSPSAF